MYSCKEHFWVTKTNIGGHIHLMFVIKVFTGEEMCMINDYGWFRWALTREMKRHLVAPQLVNVRLLQDYLTGVGCNTKGATNSGNICLSIIVFVVYMWLALMVLLSKVLLLHDYNLCFMVILVTLLVTSITTLKGLTVSLFTYACCTEWTPK